MDLHANRDEATEDVETGYKAVEFVTDVGALSCFLPSNQH